MACNRCKGTTSDPFNFLLSCSECGKNWHHRCHIPPLVDQELIALIRATNDNDVDNGLSSWTGKCCRRKRRTQTMPEAPIVEMPQPQPRSLFVSADQVSADAVHRGSPQKAAPLHGPDLKQTVATPPKPGDGCVDGDDESLTCMGSQTSVQPAVPHAGARANSALMLPDTVLPHSTPPVLSAGFALPSFNNQPAPFSPEAQERSMTLAREPSDQLAESTHVQSRLSKHPTSLGGASHASTKSMSMDINPPTLDLRALSLNRAPGATRAPSRLFLYHTTTSIPPSSPQPIRLVKSEDDEMEDLYGPPLGLPTLHALQHAPQRQRSLSLRPPAESKPRVLPVLAAKDPHVLAVLERQEQREAARPRRGMRKAQAVLGAGNRRAGFVLVEGLTTGRAEQISQWAISRK